MLFPVEALNGWAVLAAVMAVLVWRFRRGRLLWCGLAMVAAGVIYYPAVMANRPLHYYALLEFLSAAMAVGAGLVAAAAGTWQLLSARPAESPDAPSRST